ncbi:MAG: glucokinase [Actinomycetota bacterium]
MMDAPALIADIGGTHVRFALARPGSEPADVMVMRCADYPGPAEAATAYLEAVTPPVRPARAAFAVASPITGDRIDLTNSPWGFSVEGVRAQLGLDRFEVVNDFTAVALSVRHLGPAHLLGLGGGGAADGVPIGVLGPGTGLGVSALVPAKSGEWVALAAEGGHATMAPANDREAAILAWLRARFGHVSAERVLSGPGLVNLYEAVANLSNRVPAYTTPDAISQRALDGSCPVCREALDTFFAMLGTVAGNLALMLGARGGIYIAGGILPRMQGALAASGFRARFEDKGRFKSYLAPIPAWLVIHPQPAFIGLAGLATGM